MTKKTSIIFLSIALSLFSCDEVADQLLMAPAQSKKPIHALLYVDFSSSVDSVDTKQILLKNIAEVISTLPRKSIVDLYFISKNRFCSESISYYFNETKLELLEVDRQRCNMQVVSFLDKSQADFNNTCILDSFHSAKWKFQKAQKAGTHEVVICYFSDMLEACEQSDVFMESSNKSRVVDSKLFETIESYDFSQIEDFGQIVGKNIRFLLTNDNFGQDENSTDPHKSSREGTYNISQADFVVAWNLIFSKMGFANPDCLRMIE